MMRRKRLAASVVDLGVIAAWMGVIAVGSAAVRAVRGHNPDWLGALGTGGSQALGFVLLTGPVGLYLYGCESGPRQATLGKRRVGLRVTSVGGGRPTHRQIAVRTAVKLLPWELSHTFIWRLQGHFYRHGKDADPPLGPLVGVNVGTGLAFTYLGMVLVRGRGPHDLLAGTEVRA